MRATNWSHAGYMFNTSLHDGTSDGVRKGVCLHAVSDRRAPYMTLFLPSSPTSAQHLRRVFQFLPETQY